MRGVGGDISYLQYKGIAALVEEGGRTENTDYYGNTTDYSYKKLELRKLYDYLIEKDWIRYKE